MRLFPYLNFNGNCREAVNFYADLLGGTIHSIMTFGEAGQAEFVGEDAADHVMHAYMSVGDFEIGAADAPGDMYKPAGNMSLTLDVETVEDAEAKYAALADGGMAIMPLAEVFWADRYGMCIDRFGIMWQVNCTGSKVEYQE